MTDPYISEETMERSYKDSGKLFSYKNYCRLLNNMGKAAAKGNEDAIFDSEDVQRAFKSFSEYVSAVDMTETQIKLAYARFEEADLREYVEKYDRFRRSRHEAAIARLHYINEIAATYETDRIFLGNIEEITPFVVSFSIISTSTISPTTGDIPSFFIFPLGVQFIILFSTST